MVLISVLGVSIGDYILIGDWCFGYFGLWV